MRILQFIFDLSSGGAEKFTVDLTNQLAKENEVFLCVIMKEDKKLSFFKNQLLGKVNYVNLNCSKGINFKTFITIFKLLNQIKPDVVHAHLNVILYLYLPALIFKNRIKFIHTLHNLAPKTIGFKWQKSVNKGFYKRGFINAVAISRICKNSFINFYGHQKVTLVENGVTNPIITNETYEVKRKINTLKNKQSDKVFIHVARFSEQKNQQLLINVFNKVIEKKFGVILIIIGHGFDNEYAKSLKEISKEGIYYLGTVTNISDYLLNSHAFVLSSLWEGLPISLLEAISCGIIPVCTPAGGIPDVIKDETIGYISKDYTEKGLNDAIIKCLENMENFDRSNLKRYFNEYFSIEKCSKKYAKIYSQCNT